MSLKCSRIVGLRVLPPPDMPLDIAIYVASANAIFGTHGGYLHKFNATTGTLITKRRFSPIAGAQSALAYCSVDGTLWCASGFDLSRSSSNDIPEQCLGNYIYRVSTADSLATAGTLDIFALAVLRGGEAQDTAFYIGQSDATGTPLMYVLYSNAGGTVSIRKFSPTLYTYLGTQSIALGWGGPCYLEPIQLGNRLWFIENAIGGTRALEWDPSAADNLWFTGGHYHLTYLANGMCYSSATGCIYFGLRTRYVEELNLTTGVQTLIDIGGATSRVLRVRCDTTTGRIFTANSASDTVTWFIPGGTKYYKDGFDYPVDIVFTGTKIWVVQAGSTPLVELDITAPTGTVP